MSGIYAKYHVQIMLLFVYTTTRKRFVILTCRYLKLSRNTTAVSQSNHRNFSCSGIKGRSTLERTRKARAYLSSFKTEEKAEHGLITLANKPLWDAVICNIEVFKRICKCNGCTRISVLQIRVVY